MSSTPDAALLEIEAMVLNKDKGFVEAGQVVEIKTGKRRVIEYVISPLLRYKDESLRER
ncbi:MAG: hypothetical protein GKS00_19515 [Alphaproteobacteria bacterium]|nr:hypothetical protein [Alphaproteobacteria bacterium]